MNYYTKTYLAAFLLFSISISVFSQASDFLVIKKRGRTEKSVFAGMPLLFSTDNASYSAVVDRIDKDSVYLLQYDIRRMPTRLGVFVLDTVAVHRLRFHYKEIRNIDKRKYGFNWARTGGTLLGTGGLLTVLGAGSWLVTKKDTRYYARPEFVATTAALAATGYILLKANTTGYSFGKKYKLEYVRVK